MNNATRLRASINAVKRLTANNTVGGFIRAVFDPAFYVSNCRENVALGDALNHFFAVGDAKRISPTPLFNPDWYMYMCNMHGRSTSDLLRHFITKGIARNLDPHPLFSVSRYNQLTGCKRGENPILHYLRRTPDDRNKISPSEMFDIEYYLRNNPDVESAGADPFTHYLTWGWKEHRSPSPYFNTAWYLGCNPDVREANIEPLSHFVISGMHEGRQPHYLIDINYYLSGASDVAQAGMSPFRHYIYHGDMEGRSAHPLFDPAFYRANGQGIGNVNAFAHYSEIGSKSFRSPCAAFDPAYYKRMYPNCNPDPFLDYMLSARHERRHFHPLIDGEFQIYTSQRANAGTNPLVDYVQFRSHFNRQDYIKSQTFVPAPRNAISQSLISDDEGIKSFDEPKVSIIVPCYKSNPAYLTACVQSVLDQTYQNWELVLVDDGSPDRKKTWTLLQELGRQDERIKVHKLLKNLGISGATNAAIDLASGAYIALLDHDDVLTNNAISVMMHELVKSQADAAYSDQAYMSANNTVQEPFYKPDWSPVLFSGVMYVGHLLIVRTALARQAGMFLSRFDGCQDFEFMLRVSEKTKNIIHIPQVLYYWRRAEGSIAADSNAKGKIEILQQRAVNEHLERINFAGVAKVDSRVAHRLRLEPSPAPDSRLAVDVIVQGPLLAKEIDALTLSVAAAGGNVQSIHYVDWDNSPNLAIENSEAPYVLFLDSEIKFSEDNSLFYLAMHAERDDAGYVSIHKYHNNEVSAAGYVTCPKGLMPAYASMSEGQDGNAGTLLCDREVSAVGSSCTLVRRDVLTELGGLSERFVGLEGAVRDGSFRATLAGRRNVSVASPIAYLNSIKPQDSLISAIDDQIFIDSHANSLLKSDKYYNPNFAQDCANFNIG